jgi:hypothetical protein
MLNERIQMMEMEAVKLSNELDSMITKNERLNKFNNELLTLNKGRSAEAEVLQERVAELEKVREDYVNALDDTRIAADSYFRQRLEMEKKIRAEEKVNQLKQMEEMRQQWVRESALKQEHETNVKEVR